MFDKQINTLNGSSERSALQIALTFYTSGFVRYACSRQLRLRVDSSFHLGEQ